MKATFIGKTSCGFETGKEYEIEITRDSRYVYVKEKNGKGFCPYGSLAKMAENWK